LPVVALELTKNSNSGRLINRPHLQCVESFVNSGGRSSMGRDLCSDLSSSQRVTVTRKFQNSALASQLRFPNGATGKLTYSKDGTSGSFQVGNREPIKTHICRK
jgi:hypothetical protein